MDASQDTAAANEEAAIPADYDPQLYRVRHSFAHVMAEAVSDVFGDEGHVEFAIGPPTDDGFYYDFSLPRPATEQDLDRIAARMREILAGDYPFVRRVVAPDEARELFSDQPFKLELIEGLADGGDDGSPRSPHASGVITTYKQDTFEDLCRGPHVRSTRDLDPDAFKLLSVAGAYWRGDERRPMLQRIYGTAFKTPDELKRFLDLREQAAARDHRKLGRELELFHLDSTAPGMPYWLPKGLKLRNALLDFWREEHEKRGYEEIAAPLVNEKRLWEKSGHWQHYKDNMFVIPIDEHTTYGVKPMNCPNAMVVYNLKQHSYRDLPLRLSDCDVLHRYERSGTLHGLLRVQMFAQDDAHIFVSEDQIAEEYRRIFQICDLFYGLFGLTYRFRLGTRPDGFIGDLETWNRAEQELVDLLDEHSGRGNYWIEEGDGAFYGPKIDIMMDDALGRSWQMGTIQLDFQLPRRFGCTYVDAEDTQRTPVVIHRVIYGSLERFIGILIEHTGGAFPTWLSPVQVAIIPVAERHEEAAHAVAARLKRGRVRVEVDATNRRMGAKIREAQVQKTPYTLVIGDREVESDSVSVRVRGQREQRSVGVAEFEGELLAAIEERRPL